MKYILAYLIFGAVFGLFVASERTPHQWLGNMGAGMVVGVPAAIAVTARAFAHELDAQSTHRVRLFQRST